MRTNTSVLLLGMAIMVVYLVSTSSPALATIPSQNASDRAVLVALYNATSGPNWTNNTNWLSNAPLSDWYGVTTDTNGRITRLELPDKNLSGPIPPELGNLASLSVLNLSKNRLRGSIPPELGNLTNLTDLSLIGNQLTGPIPPELGNLTSLEWLFIKDNQLSGPLPQSLIRLSTLVIFSFEGNSGLCAPTNADFQVWLKEIQDAWGSNCGSLLATPASQSPIPISKTRSKETTTATDRSALVALYNATNGPNWKDNSGWLSNAPIGVWYGVDTDVHGRVTVLNLRFNHLKGTIPSELGSLTELKVLDLWINGLNGTIPPQLGNLANLESMVLSVNKLSGPIPPDLGNLTNSKSLSLGGNQLDGAIPSELGNLINLESLDLSGNQLSGPIPRSLGNLTSLKRLALGRNLLTGILPQELPKLSHLRYLDLENNPGLCAPTDADFQVWLEAIEDKSGPDCGAVVPVVQTSPDIGQFYKGRTLHVSIAAMDRLLELRYSSVDQDGKVAHLRIAPSKDTMELVVFRVKVQNHTTNSVIFTADEESSRLRDYHSNSYFPLDVGESADVVDTPPWGDKRVKEGTGVETGWYLKA